MNKENLIKVLVPVIAVVVIVESVVLVSGLNKSDMSETETYTVMTEEENVNPVADFVFSTDTREMQMGESYEVNLNLSANESFAVDAIEVHMKYDPTKVSISKLTAGDDLPETTTFKIDEASGLVNAIFLVPVEDRDGYSVDVDDNKNILSFMVTPIEAGTFELSLETDSVDGSLPTVLPETGTSNSLPFTTNKLEINVTE